MQFSRPVTVLRCCLMLGVLLPFAGYAAQLLHDPFAPPDFEPQQEDVKNNAEQAVKREDWRPELRATMRAGRQSMANIDGRIVRIGEEIDGFRLVKVHERDAFFVKRGLKYHVSMDLDEDDIVEN